MLECYVCKYNVTIEQLTQLPVINELHSFHSIRNRGTAVAGYTYETTCCLLQHMGTLAHT